MDNDESWEEEARDYGFTKIYDDGIKIYTHFEFRPEFVVVEAGNHYVANPENIPEFKPKHLYWIVKDAFNLDLEGDEIIQWIEDRLELNGYEMTDFARMGSEIWIVREIQTKEFFSIEMDGSVDKVLVFHDPCELGEDYGWTDESNQIFQSSNDGSEYAAYSLGNERYYISSSTLEPDNWLYRLLNSYFS